MLDGVPCAVIRVRHNMIVGEKKVIFCKNENAVLRKNEFVKLKRRPSGVEKSEKKRNSRDFAKVLSLSGNKYAKNA